MTWNSFVHVTSILGFPNLACNRVERGSMSIIYVLLLFSAECDCRSNNGRKRTRIILDTEAAKKQKNANKFSRSPGCCLFPLQRFTVCRVKCVLCEETKKKSCFLSPRPFVQGVCCVAFLGWTNVLILLFYSVREQFSLMMLKLLLGLQ